MDCRSADQARPARSEIAGGRRFAEIGYDFMGRLAHPGIAAVLLECGWWCKLTVRIEIPKLRERNKFALSTDLVLVFLTVADCSLSLLDVLCAALGYCGENMSDCYVLLAILAAVTSVALGAGKTAAATSVHYAAVSCRCSAGVVDPEERERMAAREAAAMRTRMPQPT